MARRFRGLRSEPRDSYDVVVIGAGVGGLICSNLLVRAGMKVLLVEQHCLVGGYCSTFRRKGYTFDAATHFYPLLGNPSTITGSLLSELEMTTEWVKKDPVDSFHFPDGSRFSVPASLEVYLEKLKKEFPEEAGNIDSFFALVRKAYMVGLVHYFRNVDTERILPYQRLSIREVLNRTALRRMAVLRPLKVVIENYPEGESEEIEAVNHPDDPAAGTRRIAFGRELYIERDDFMENPPKKFFRLSPGTEVRLRYAYFIKCTDVIKNAAGDAIELRCTYDPATRGGNAPDGRKVKATMHWLPAAQSIPAEIRIYNQLFSKPVPDAANFAADLNPQSLEVLKDARIEPAIAQANSNDVMQFERQGYFVRDPDSTPDRPVFNRTIGLRDTFAKEVGTKG